MKREAARKLAAIEAEKRARSREARGGDGARRRTLTRRRNVAAAASGVERDARELRAKYEAMLAAKKRKAGTEGKERKGTSRARSERVTASGAF